jgi:tetratricopeptide (TPR) repeat protein
MSISLIMERSLEHAEGYLELGMFGEALEVLEKIEKDFQDHPKILKIKLEILMAQKDWKKATQLGRGLCKSAPLDSEVFINTAFCLHELKLTEEAKEILLAGPKILKTNPLFYYNLGCYLAQLSQNNEAEECVKRAISMDPLFRKLALDDPDLTSILPVIKKFRVKKQITHS